MKTAAILILSYFLGSLPFGLIVAFRWRGVDIRKYGSGNIGATNVYRALGRGPGAVVFVLDILKGLIPVLIARQWMPNDAWTAVGVAILAILGHTFSVFLKFRGGKGAATSLGVIIGLDWRVAVVTFVVWFIVLAISRFVSLASIAGAVSVPVMMFALGMPLPYKIFGLVAGACVIAKHRSNISRLMNGTEARIGQRVDVKEESPNDEERS
jgi:glycerol-3-phosphate acyltransferase PlsY